MSENFSRKMNRRLKENRRRKQLGRVVAVLSALVVLIVVGQLMQPVNTMTTICGREEHTHTDACYEQRLVCGQDEGEEHVHGDSCYERVLACGQSEHTHTDACYPAPTEAPVVVTEAPVITGTSREVFDHYGLNAEGIAKTVRECL